MNEIFSRIIHRLKETNTQFEYRNGKIVLKPYSVQLKDGKLIIKTSGVFDEIIIEQNPPFVTIYFKNCKYTYIYKLEGEVELSIDSVSLNFSKSSKIEPSSIISTPINGA